MLTDPAPQPETAQAGARHGRSAAMSARIQLGGHGFWEQDAEPVHVAQPARVANLAQSAEALPAQAQAQPDAGLHAARLLAAEVLTLRQQRDTSDRQIRALLAKVHQLEAALASAGIDPAA